jgi:hypothetical protein
MCMVPSHPQSTEAPGKTAYALCTCRPPFEAPERKYDYACLMANDASPEGTLSSAWTELHPQTRRSFWEGANVYVMILRGSST